MAATLTMDQVDKAIDLEAARKTAKGEDGPGFCGPYLKARPVLIALVAIPFLPRKWRDVVQQFMATADMVCPV